MFLFLEMILFFFFPFLVWNTGKQQSRILLLSFYVLYITLQKLGLFFPDILLIMISQKYLLHNPFLCQNVVLISKLLFLFLFIYLFLFFIFFTCDPKHEPPSHLPPHNIPLGHPHAPAKEESHFCWAMEKPHCIFKYFEHMFSLTILSW